MSITVKVESAAAEFGPKQAARGQGHDYQRNHGLPVRFHALKIGGWLALATGLSAGIPVELFYRRPTLPRMSHQTFVHPYRVTYRDCTLGNHVYYANYLGILEAARGEFFRGMGATLLKWQEAGFMFPVVEAHLRYKALARYDDILDIEVWVTAAERVRLNFGYRLVNQSATLVLEGETLHACLGLDEKMKRLPEDLITAVKPYLRDAAA